MLVRNTAVAMSDGGGGGGRTTFGLNQIPISDIEYYYNKGSGFTDDEMNLIKSSKKIDAEAVESARLELEEKITEIDTLFTTNYGVIDALLENSNSVLLAKGIDAQAQRENLASVRDTLHAALDNITEMGDAETVANDYNDKLKEIKNGVMLQLLIREADKLNAAVDSRSTTYKYFYSDIDTYENLSLSSVAKISDTESQFSKVLRTYTETTTDEYTELTTNRTRYVCRVYNVAYCNYWGLCGWGRGEGPKWYLPWTWGDDNVEKIRSKLIEVNSKLAAAGSPRIAIPDVEE